MDRRSFLLSAGVLSSELSAVGRCFRRDRGTSQGVQKKGTNDTLGNKSSARERDPNGGHDESEVADAGSASSLKTTLWSFAGGERAVVIVPAHATAENRLPVVVALHGRGEALKGPAVGVYGWPRDYALVRAMTRVSAPPLRRDDYEGFVEPEVLARTNAQLRASPFRGLVVVCPYVPDIELRKPSAPGALKAYGSFVVSMLLPRVRAELPVLDAPEACGIDGVSLGGAVALRVGLAHPEVFGAVGSLQAAISDEQIDEFTRLAQAARQRRPTLALRLLTSRQDYFHSVISRTSAAWKKAGIVHEFADGPGPHDYPFNRGPGAIEMLLWHDRVLSHRA